jgi:NADH-quinone oxidoreductase subunit N
MAYSSINQMGFLLMGVSCGTFEGYRSALIYLFLYVLMNAGFFVLFLCTKEKTSNRSLTYLTDLNDFAKRNSMFSFALVIVFFSMAGIPPLGGFFGKYFIFLENLNSGHTGLVIIGMLTSVIATYYYLRIIKLMLFEKTTDKRFIFQVHMSKPLKEVYIQIIFVLIAFVLATP